MKAMSPKAATPPMTGSAPIVSKPRYMAYASTGMIVTVTAAPATRRMCRMAHSVHSRSGDCQTITSTEV